jgi:hypothetical protein
VWRRGRKPRVPDHEIAELRRRHIEQQVPLRTLSRESGLSVSMLTKIMNGQRRKNAGGPTRKAAPKPQLTSRTLEAIKRELRAGRKGYVIARKYHVSKSYVNDIKRSMR